MKLEIPLWRFRQNLDFVLRNCVMKPYNTKDVWGWK